MSTMDKKPSPASHPVSAVEAPSHPAGTVPNTAAAAAPLVTTVKDDSPSGKARDGVSFGPKHGAGAAAAPHNNNSSTSKRFSTSSAGSGQLLGTDRMKALVAGLQDLPELTLEEATRVRAVFTQLMGERESISNILELRVVLGDLGLYPTEEELLLVLEAYRGKVGLSSLCNYLRFYKHAFSTSAKIDAAQEQLRLSGTNGPRGGAAQSQQQQRLPWANARTGTTNETFPPSATRAGADAGYTFGASNTKRTIGDPDTLKAFVALGGNEDGSGEIKATALSAVVRQFGLTVDIDAMIAVVDVHRSGVLDYDDFCTMWTLPEEAVRRNSLASFSVLDASRSPRREDDSAVDALVAQSGGDISPSTQRARERIIAALARSGRQSITLTQGLPWKTASGNASPRNTLIAPNTAGSPRGAGLSTTPPVVAQGGVSTVSPPAVGSSGSQRVRPMYSCAQTNPVLQSPISPEEHILLLTIYLFPERYEGVFPRLGESTTAGRRGQHASVGGVMGGATTRRSVGGRKTATRSGANARSRSAKGEEDDGLGGKGANGYRPPSPMILSMRTSAAYQERKTAKLREPIRCPYHGSGLTASMAQHSSSGGYAATSNPTAAQTADDGFDSHPDAY